MRFWSTIRATSISMALLRAHRAKHHQRPLHAGADRTIELFEQALAEHRPRLYITNSALHNPTGATLSPVVAHRVLKLAEQAAAQVDFLSASGVVGRAVPVRSSGPMRSLAY